MRMKMHATRRGSILISPDDNQRIRRSPRCSGQAGLGLKLFKLGAGRGDQVDWPTQWMKRWRKVQ